MLKKFTYRLLKSGIAVVLVTYILLLIIFFPWSGRHSLLQKDARLSFASSPASPGATIMVNGFEYRPAEKVEVYVQDKTNGVVSTTTNAGGFFNVPLTLPKKYIDGSAYVYIASDGSTTKALLKFAKPALSYTPALKSTRASFKGANEPISFMLSNGSKTLKTGIQRTDNQGHFALALALPDLPFASHVMLVVNDAAHKRHVSIAVRYSPRIQLSAFAGSINRRVRVVGKGFKQREEVFVEFQGKVVAIINANEKGDFQAQFNVPTWAESSPYYDNVKATGRESRASASDSFQVLPSVSLNPNTGVPGQAFTVVGSQFTPHKPVHIVLFSPGQGASSVGASLENTSALRTGVFEARFTIPRDIQRRKVYSILYIDTASGLDVVTYFKVQ